MSWSVLRFALEESEAGALKLAVTPFAKRGLSPISSIMDFLSNKRARCTLCLSETLKFFEAKINVLVMSPINLRKRTTCSLEFLSFCRIFGILAY